MNDGSNCVTGAGIRPERRFGSSVVSGPTCAANASGSSSISASLARVGTSFSFSGGSSTSLTYSPGSSSP